jgi:hypothetical protein
VSRFVAAVLLVTCTACATSVDDSNTSTDDTSDAGDGGSTAPLDGAMTTTDGGAHPDGATGADAATASDMACQMMRTTPCVRCCQTNRMAGINAYVADIQACACGAMGPCTSVCATEYCQTGQAVAGDSCATCILSAVQGQCATQINTACSANADCAGYVACANGC